MRPLLVAVEVRRHASWVLARPRVRARQVVRWAGAPVPLIAMAVALLMGTHTATAGESAARATRDMTSVWCTYDGAIEKGDVASFRKSTLSGCKTLYLNSPGGDVDTAMEIGRLARSRSMTVVVRSDSTCASACVLIYAGGVTRLPYSPIQIHRPYGQASTSSFESTQRKFHVLGLRVRAYLREMNVSEGLYERMMEIEPERTRKLTMDEMDALGLGGVDPIYQEFVDATRAARLGMTRAAMTQQKREVTALCGNIEAAVHESRAEEMLSCWRRHFPGFFFKH